MTAADPHLCAARYMCRTCKQPLGLAVPFGWVCGDDGDTVAKPMTLDDIVKQVNLEQLHQLWAISLAYQPWRIDAHPVTRQAWVAHAYVRLSPEHGHDTAIYKAIERLGVGAVALTSDQIKAQHANLKFRKGLIS